MRRTGATSVEPDPAFWPWLSVIAATEPLVHATKTVVVPSTWPAGSPVTAGAPAYPAG
jgi:hypothetical protein